MCACVWGCWGVSSGLGAVLEQEGEQESAGRP